MSTPRLIFFVIFSAACVTWAAGALYAHAIRLEYKELVNTIRAGEKEPDARMIDIAITDYTSTINLLPCRMGLHQDLGLLLAYRTDLTLNASDINASSDALDAMQKSLGALLSCTPTDGKAWLDLAMIDTYREGFTKHALDAYKMSEKVTPGESWLAEKRMLFALQFRPLLDDEARKVVIANDMKTLERAHPNRMKAVMDAAAVTTPEALYALFAQPAA